LAALCKTGRAADSLAVLAFYDEVGRTGSSDTLVDRNCESSWALKSETLIIEKSCTNRAGSSAAFTGSHCEANRAGCDWGNSYAVHVLENEAFGATNSFTFIINQREVLSAGGSGALAVLELEVGRAEYLKAIIFI